MRFQLADAKVPQPTSETWQQRQISQLYSSTNATSGSSNLGKA